MMKKDHSLTQQHEAIDGDINKKFTVQVFKGTVARDTSYKTFRRVVGISAFRIVVGEEWSWNGIAYHAAYFNFGYVSARSGEIAYALRRIKEECKSIEDIRLLLAELEVNFRVALKKDAMRKLKKELGLHKVASPVVNRMKNYSPLPHIQLPGES